MILTGVILKIEINDSDEPEGLDVRDAGDEGFSRLTWKSSSASIDDRPGYQDLHGLVLSLEQVLNHKVLLKNKI